MIVHYENKIENILEALQCALDNQCVMTLSSRSFLKSDVSFLPRLLTLDDIKPGAHFFIASPEWTVEYPPVRETQLDGKTFYHVDRFGGPVIELTHYMILGSDRKKGGLRLKNKTMMATTSLIVNALEKAISMFKSMGKILRKNLNRTISSLMSAHKFDVVGYSL